MQGLHIRGGFALRGLAIAEGRGGLRHELASPFGDLIRVHVEALGELGERHVAFDAAKATLALKAAE